MTITCIACCLLKTRVSQKDVCSSKEEITNLFTICTWTLFSACACVCEWQCICQCVFSVCMLHYTTWQVQSPVGWHCCILHLAEHIQHIRGVTNPFLTARTFQRVSVPVNNTSSGFHTSELMCVWHTDTHRWNVASHRSAWPRERERELDS